MAEPSSKAEKDLASLKTTVDTVVSLISQLLSATKLDSTRAQNTEPNHEVNALDLAHNAAKLIRAHSTKLSLLIINSPFTPTAIMTVLREVSSGPLPALATAVELCDAELYTKVMRAELQWRVEKVLVEFSNLLEEIPLNGRVLSKDRKNGTAGGMGKGSLASTGMVWQACDSLAELKTLGIAGLLIKKTEQYRDTLKDALEELQEWGEETSEDEEEDDDIAHEGNGHVIGGGGHELESAQDAIDSIFHDQRHIPRSDPNNIRGRLERTLPQLKLVTHLYQAMIKRRFKIIPVLPEPESSSVSIQDPASKSDKMCSIMERIDNTLLLLKRIPDMVDDLANAFYELDVQDIDERMRECFLTGSAAAELLLKDWKGHEDEFSLWVDKFLVAMQR